MKPEQLLKTLKENPDNPRTISKEKFEKLKNNISKFTKMLELRPIVYNKKNIVLGGNMRLKAIRELVAENKIRLKENYFKKAESLTAEEQRQFIILDNQDFGEWDFDILANDYEMDDLLDFGFTEKKIGIKNYNVKDISEEIQPIYEISIECKNENEQQEYYNKLIKEGYKCRILTL